MIIQTSFHIFSGVFLFILYLNEKEKKLINFEKEDLRFDSQSVTVEHYLIIFGKEEKRILKEKKR